jgi:fumarate reductase flavoprotein subunit
MKKFFAILSAAALSVTLAACGTSSPAADTTAADSAGSGVSGTFTGEAAGQGGEGNPVKVTVTLENSKIVDVKAEGPGETQGIGSKAIEALPPQMASTGSIAVDVVTGASVTSNAIMTAAGLALESAGLNPEDYKIAVSSEPTAAEDIDKNCDVLVVGAGGAGMIAAITASDAGKRTIILESTGMAGGNSVRSTGGMNAGKTVFEDANEFGETAGVEKTIAAAEAYTGSGEAEIKALTETVKKQWADYQAKPSGYFDSTELFRLDTMIGGKGINDPVLVQKLADDSASAIDWLDEIGAELHSVGAFGGASVKRIHRPVNAEGKTTAVGAYVIPILEKNLGDRGIEVLYNTTAKSLISDASGIVGVEAETANGGKVTVHAKAVILATGGFGANNEMVVAQNHPELKGYITTNAPGILGQGIEMGMAAGAETVDMDQIQLHPTVHVAEDGSANLITEGLRGDGAILVNAEGKRFYDEVSTRDKVSDAENKQTGGYAWLIVDQKMYDASAVIQGYVSKGWTVTGDSPEALAKEMNMDGAVLKETMDAWNACVEAKEDKEFGRTSFAEKLEGTLYALTVQPGIHHTMGGLKINDRCEVLKPDGTAIPRLFAAGEVTGGVHGGNRLGGNAVADFVVFGRVAGESAAAAAVTAKAEVPEGAVFAAGTYSAQAVGFGGSSAPVKVSVTFSDNEITDIEYTADGETPTVGGAAIPQLKEDVLAAQSSNIDMVSGATISSSAFLSAMNECITQAGADPASLTAKTVKEPEKDIEETVDVVVAGAGGAGMTAAITAAQAGKKVIILEKAAVSGGNSSYATGGMNAAATHYQKEQGIEDSADLYYEDTMKGGHDINNPDLVRTLANNSSAAIDWLDSIGAPLSNIGLAGGASAMRQHRPVNEEGKILSVGAYLVEHLTSTCEKEGVKILYNAKVDEILMENGKAVGLHAVGKSGNSITVKANNVVIATGGFGSNPDMIVKYRPDLKGYVSTNAPSITGDLIPILEGIGADFVDLEQIQIHPTVVQKDGSLISESLRGDGAILLNKEGRRFCNEILTRDVVSGHIIDQPESYAWLIADEGMAKESTVIEKYVSKGLMTKCDSVKDLAALMEVDEAVLKKSLETWTAACAAKKDSEFEREGFDALLTDLSNPPYYAVKIAPGIHHCMGGVRIDTDAKVIGKDGKAIEDLFAAGEVTGGVHGGNRLGGNAVADFVVFGRIAGENAAK